ncbi:MAG TPA: DUF2007 domain-containing protein [Thermoanaerobaculia bacterium]
MASDDLVTIDRFLFIANAEIARATLEAAGIDAVLADENIVRMSWGDAQAHGGVRLQVRAEDAEEARAVLAESDFSGAAAPSPPEDVTPLEPDETCRRCGSEEIFFAESRAKTYARALLFMILGFVLLRLASCGAAMADRQMPQKVMNVALLLVVLIPIVALALSNMLPKKRCRNCGLEWRGTPRTN